MSAASLYPVHPEAVARTFTDEATYKTMYQQSVVNPDGFWREQAQRIDWIKPFEKVKQTSFDDHHVDIKWFADGTLNVSHNCLDRHLAERGDQVAIIWEGDDPADHQEITYRQLHEQVCKFANALRGQDVHRGDVVTIYMPMIPRPWSPCSPAPASARSTRWSSAASPPRPWQDASSIASRRW